MDNDSLVPIAWEVFFNEEYPEKILDINKPENSARMSAEAHEKAEKFKSFVTGYGKPLFDKWGKDMKAQVLAMIFNPVSNQCTCPVCLQIREIRKIFELLIEAEQITKGGTK